MLWSTDQAYPGVGVDARASLHRFVCAACHWIPSFDKSKSHTTCQLHIAPVRCPVITDPAVASKIIAEISPCGALIVFHSSVLTLQSNMFPSASPPHIHSPSGAKESAVTRDENPGSNRDAPDRERVQSRAAPSSPPDANISPVGLNARLRIGPSCPVNPAMGRSRSNSR